MRLFYVLLVLALVGPRAIVAASPGAQSTLGRRSADRARAEHHLRSEDPHAEGGARLRHRRAHHAAGGSDGLPEGVARGGARTHRAARIRADLGAAAAVRAHRRVTRAHRGPRGGEARSAAPRRSARPGAGRGRRDPGARAGRHVADARRPRRRGLVVRRGADGGVSPARGARRRRRRHDPARVDRDHRSAAEPGRPGPLRLDQPAGRGRDAGCRAVRGRARPAVARRPLQPLPVRHEPRLVRADAARDARPRRALPRVLAARRRRPARDGRRVELLLRAAGRSDQPAHHEEPAEVVRRVRPRQRRDVRRARLRLLHPRGLRLVLSGLRRVLADLPGRHRHDLRAGVGARAALPARRRRGAVVPRRRPAPLHRRDHDGRDRGEEPRRDPARLLRLPARRGERR